MIPRHDPEDEQMATLLPFPGTTPATDIEPAPPVVEAEIIDDTEPAYTQAASTTVTAAASTVPLTPRHAGPLRYAGSVITHGTRRTPIVLWDRAWDAIKHADLREGNTHRGRVADKHITEHGRRTAHRREAAATALRAVAVPWTRWQVRLGKVPMPVVTWGATAGCLTAAAYPDTAVLAPFALVNRGITALTGATASIAWHVAETVASATWPYFVPAGLAVSVCYGITAEHRRRQNLVQTVPQAALTPAEVTVDEHADYLSSAFISAGVIKADQRIELRGIPYQVPGGVCAPIRLPRGTYTGQIRQADRLTKLASVLDTTAQHLSVTDGDTARECDLTVYKILPFTGPAVPHPLLGGGRVDVLREGVPAGLDINAGLVRLDIKGGRHGLIVASSGNGKSQHIMSLMLSLAVDPSSSFALLDGKPDGTLDPIRPLVDEYVEASGDGYLEAAADLLENELVEMRDRQARIRGGEQVGWRQIVLDEFQMFTGNPAAGEVKKGSPQRRIRDGIVEISRLGRSTNVGLVLATQSYDGNTIDAAVLINIGWRLIGFAPSDMSREALGEHAARYGLDTSKMLVDTVQTGTAVMIAPNIERYAVARGWYQPKTTVAAAVERLLELRRQDGRNPQPSRAGVIPRGVGAKRGPLPSVLELLVDVIDDDETGIVPTQELARRLGYPDPAKAGAKRLGEELALAKVPSPPRSRWPGYKSAVSLTDLDAVKAAIVNRYAPQETP